MSFFEFPHTRTYDSDLGFIIHWIKTHEPELENLEEWKARHSLEYKLLAEKVDGLIRNLVDVIVPWDSSVEYPIFSMVEYQGQNYIALQDVPVGVMITNTDYWQPANTIVEQINAMSIIVSNMDKWRPYVTAEEYGAVGDGETDDTAAINDAIAGSLEKHVPLVMPQTYLVSGLTITDDNVQIYCTGEIKYNGINFAVTVSGQFSEIYIDTLTARNGSGMLITPNGKPAYMLDIQINTLRASWYGIKLKDYVDPNDATHRYGVLYNKIKCKRIRTDADRGHCLDFESAYFIGETDLDIELCDLGKVALYAVCTGDAINAIRTSLFAVEGNLDIFYLDNVRSCVFNGLRYGETLGYNDTMFLTAKGNCIANYFFSPTQLKLSRVDVEDVTGTQYNQLNMPISNDSGVMIGLGAKFNQFGVKFIGGYNSGVTIGVNSDYEYRTAANATMKPTQFNITKPNSDPDFVKIYLDHSYAWDGINRIQILMNGANYRPVIYNTDGNILYDFRNLSGSENNGAYELIFNRSTNTLQSVMISRPSFIATVGSQPL